MYFKGYNHTVCHNLVFSYIIKTLTCLFLYLSGYYDDDDFSFIDRGLRLCVFFHEMTMPNSASSGIKVRIEMDNAKSSFKLAAITDTYKYSCIALGKWNAFCPDY